MQKEKKCKYEGCDVTLEYKGRGRPPEYCKEHCKLVIKERKQIQRQKEKKITESHKPLFKNRLIFKDGHWISKSARHNKESWNLWKTCLTMDIRDLPILIDKRRNDISWALQNQNYKLFKELKLQIRVIQDAYIWLAHKRDLEDYEATKTSWMFDEIGYNIYGGLELKKVQTKRIYNPDYDLLVDVYDE